MNDVTRPWLGAVADARKALQSLQWRDPQGPWLLGASDRENKHWQWALFTAAQSEECVAWIAARESEACNIYQSLNRVRLGLNKKATKADITAALAVFADVDVPDKPDHWTSAPEEWALVAQDTLWSVLNERWPSELPRPTVLMFSGGGFQLIWEVATPYTEADRVELFERMTLYVQERIAALGVKPDSTQNIDRLHRLNRTTNRPKAKKQARGQTDAVASVVRTDRKYSIDELRAAFDHPVSKPERTTATGGPIEAVKVTDDDLAAFGCDEVLLSIIRDGRSAYSMKMKDNTRSAWEWEAACRLIRLGLTDAQIAGVFLNPAWKVSERALERRDPSRHVGRLIASARNVTGHVEKQFACQDGRPIKCRFNYIVAIHKLGVRLAYNEFADQLVVSGMEDLGPQLDEKTIGQIRFLIDDRFGFLPDKELLGDVLANECVRNRFHPVRDHLDKLKWDGVPRLDRWLVDYCKAKDTGYVREAGRVFLIAAVRRVKHPGTKFDSMMILEGKQGSYKSTAIRVIAGNDDWFSDFVPIGDEGNRVIEHTRGKWILEEGELATMGARDAERLKAFLSRVFDRGRLAYERRAVDVPRSFVVCGTTNKGSYLTDPTGARRFMPIKVGKIDIHRLIADRDQLIAEAVTREAEGESIVMSEDVDAEATSFRVARTLQDAWLETLRPLAVGNEIWSGMCWKALEIPAAHRDKTKQARLADCLEALGFERAEVQPPSGAHAGVLWVRTSAS